jgi:hypothetical protein
MFWQKCIKGNLTTNLFDLAFFGRYAGTSVGKQLLKRNVFKGKLQTEEFVQGLSRNLHDNSSKAVLL